MRALERDPSLSAAYFGVAVSGALLMAIAGMYFGARSMAGVAVGVVIALANLWALERFVRMYLKSERGRWSVVALVKTAVLFVLVALLVKSGAVSILPLVAGFGALPIGVIVGGAWPTANTR